MMHRTLLLPVMLLGVAGVFAQSNQRISGFAITSQSIGQYGGWREVRMLDMTTGQSLQDIYQSKQEAEIFNARTGARIELKKDNNTETYTVTHRYSPGAADKAAAPAPPTTVKVYIRDKDGNLQPADANLQNITTAQDFSRTTTRTVTVHRGGRSGNHPFATNSAACAYDKKHDRLYYTPMGINQLRYIDLKSKTPKIYYFENEAFGVVGGSWDTDNHITRMTFAADKNGYALTNNANHLIRFTTGKKPEITDLGAITDDAANGQNSVHSRNNYGGDMIADNAGNLYLIGANQAVFKINIETRTATYQGRIKGLPAGYTTNGAMVQEGSRVIVSSSQQGTGYYVFDLKTMQAEKISQADGVFMASDLANGVLAKVSDKKKDQQPVPAEEKTVTAQEEITAKKVRPDAAGASQIAVYPNPVTEKLVRLSFTNQEAGKYLAQFVDLNGQLIFSQELNIAGKNQVEEIRLPQSLPGGTYMLRVLGVNSKLTHTSQVIVQ